MAITGNNLFLNTFGKQINNLIYELETVRLKGGYGGNGQQLDLGRSIALYKACIKEIESLHKQKTELVKALDHKESEIDLLTSRLNSTAG